MVRERSFIIKAAKSGLHFVWGKVHHQNEPRRIGSKIRGIHSETHQKTVRNDVAALWARAVRTPWGY